MEKQLIKMPVGEFTLKYMKAFSIYERDFLEALIYIYPSDDHLGVYSHKFIILMLSIASEIEAFLKHITNNMESIDTSKNIITFDKLMEKIRSYDSFYSNLSQDEVKINGIKKQIIPWENNEKVPQWWRSHNKVKHARFNETYLKEANLENCLMLLSALYTLLLRYYWYLEDENFTYAIVYPQYKSAVLSVTTIKEAGAILAKQSARKL